MDANTIKALENAVHLLADGHLYSVGGLIFRAIGKTDIEVTGCSAKTDLNTTTRNSSTVEMGDIKKEFAQMLSISSIFKDYMKDKGIRFCLIYDYGMGAIDLCEEVNGHVTWNPNVPSLL